MLNTYIVSRMNDWANWRVRLGDSGLGYPKKVIYSDLMPGSSHFGGSPEYNEECLDIDRCVVAVRAISMELYEVIMLHYVCVNWTQMQKLKHLGCCKASYYNKIEQANRLLLGFLNDLAAEVALPQPKINY